MYIMRLVSYKIYKFRLNWINKRRLSKGELPISDSKGHPYYWKKYQTLIVKPLSAPLGKVFYMNIINKRITRKNKINKLLKKCQNIK